MDKEQIAQIQNEFQTMEHKIDQKQFLQMILPHVLDGHTDYILGIDICDQRNLLVSASCDHTVKLWDLQNFKLLKTYGDTGYVYDVVFSNNGNLIAYGGWRQIISLIDISDLNKQGRISELKGHSQEITCLISSSDSMYLISGSLDHTVRIWNVKTEAESCQLNLNSPILDIAINKDNSLIAGQTIHKVFIWNLKKQKLLFTLSMYYWGFRVQFSKDQKMLVTLGKGDLIHFWSLQQLCQGKLSLVRKLGPSGSQIYSAQLTSDSRFLLSLFQTKLIVMDFITGQLIKKFKVLDKGQRNGVISITRNFDMIAHSAGFQIIVWKKD